MESKAIPTITEHFIEFYKDHAFKEHHEYPSDADIREFTTDPYFIATMKSLHEYAVLFAKHQVEEQRNSIAKKAQRMSNGVDVVLLSDIENAYSEDNIK